MPRVVRLGRAANDNLRPVGRLLGPRVLAVTFATAVTMLCLYGFGLI